MKQFSNLQSDGLDRIEELSGAEAAQINGGALARCSPDRYVPQGHDLNFWIYICERSTHISTN